MTLRKITFALEEEKGIPSNNGYPYRQSEMLDLELAGNMKEMKKITVVIEKK